MVAALLLCGASGVSAQDTQGGLTADLALAQGIEFSDRDDTRAVTELDFGLTSETRSQTLTFGIGTDVEVAFDDGLDPEIVNPRSSLSYVLDGRDTALTTQISYRRSDADALVQSADGEVGTLVLDEGKRERIAASFGLEFGRETPFGGSVSLSEDHTNFFDTTSDELIGSDRTTAGLDLRFDIDERITATLGYSRSDFDQDDGRSVDTETLTAGAIFAVSPTIDATFNVGVTEVAVSPAGGGAGRIEDGLTFDFAITQAIPTGSLRYSLSSDLSENGRRTTASTALSLETRRGVLNASVGIVESTDDKIRPLLSLQYAEDLRRGSYSVSLDQSFASNTDGDETLNSRMRLAWQSDLTATSRLAADLTYQVSDVLGADDDTERLSVGLGLSRDLTDDWALATRYRLNVSDGDDRDLSRENEIFIGLETSLGWRP